VAQDRKYKKQA